jgi:predicted Zn finger-like uncharacterized protein
MSAVRLRRLQADYLRLQEYVQRHPRVQLIQTRGSPPEQYQLQYQIESLRERDGRLIHVDTHLVEITLPLNYPRVPPQCRMLTPIFHPNIAPHAICIGDHWSAGETLSSIVTRIGELIAYQSYNVKSPLNGEAARWTSENLDRLPLDPVNMLVEETSPSPGPRTSKVQPPAAADGPPHVHRPVPSASPPVVSAPPAPKAITFTCSNCQATLRVTADLVGKRVRCPRCNIVSTVTPPG